MGKPVSRQPTLPSSYENTQEEWSNTDLDEQKMRPQDLLLGSLFLQR